MTENRIRRDAQPHTEAEIRAVTVGEIQALAGTDRSRRVRPGLAGAVRAGERSVFGPRSATPSVRLEHTGSTSVPGLAAKPIIDMTLVVAGLR